VLPGLGTLLCKCCIKASPAPMLRVPRATRLTPASYAFTPAWPLPGPGLPSHISPARNLGPSPSPPHASHRPRAHSATRDTDPHVPRSPPESQVPLQSRPRRGRSGSGMDETSSLPNPVRCRPPREPSRPPGPPQAAKDRCRLTRPVRPAFRLADDGDGMGQPGLPCARWVDVRRKSFVAEATSRLAFLCGEHGFADRTSRSRTAIRW
jgi:hypothetical protein